MVLHVSVTKHVILFMIVAQISMTLAVSIKKALVLRPILVVVVQDLFHPVMEQEEIHHVCATNFATHMVIVALILIVPGVLNQMLLPLVSLRVFKNISLTHFVDG